MKKLLLLGCLSIAGVCVSVNDAQAWFLDCCRNWCCHDRCCTTVCVRPYNAFTPVCCGSISGQGCCPINMCGGYCPQPCAPSCFRQPNYGCTPSGPGCGPMGYCGPGYCMNGGGDFGCLPAPGAVAVAPQGPAQAPMMQGQPIQQAIPGQQLVAPNPQMLNQGAYMMPRPMTPAYGYTPVQPIAYYQGYQPTYNPYGYAPPMQMPMNNPYGQFQGPPIGTAVKAKCS